MGGHMDVVVALLTRGADINSQDDKGETVLHYAAEWGEEEMLVGLLERGADVDAVTRRGWTALYCAVRTGDSNRLSVLLQHGSKIEARNVEGLTALQIAIEEGEGEEIENVFLREIFQRAKSLATTWTETARVLNLESLANLTHNSAALLMILAILEPRDHVYPRLIGDEMLKMKLYSTAMVYYNIGIHLDPANEGVHQIRDIKHTTVYCYDCLGRIVGFRYIFETYGLIPAGTSLCTQCYTMKRRDYEYATFLQVPGRDWELEIAGQCPKGLEIDPQILTGC